MPIPVSEQSLRLKSLKRQVDYSNHDYEGYENEPVRESGRSHRGGVDHADSYDQGYEQDDRERDTDADEQYADDEHDRYEERRPVPRIRSPYQGRRQRSARYLDDYDEEVPMYEDDDRSTRLSRGGSKRMYDGGMPPFKVRAGRMAQMDNNDPVEV